MDWTIWYNENGNDRAMKLSGTPRDVEEAIEKIESKSGRIAYIENSKGSVYYPIAKKEA